MSKLDYDKELVAIATEAVQSHERLHLHLKRLELKHGPKDVLIKSIQTLDNIRDIKAVVDGSSIGYQAPYNKDDCLTELKHLTLMHIPSSITDEARSKFKNLIEETYKGCCRKILFAALITCPWYEMTQKERGEQARHNTVYVVYMSYDKQFIAPVNQHVLDEAFISDQGYLYSEELYHFVHFLVKGKTRCLEVLFCPQAAILYEDECWTRLKNNLHHKTAMGIRGFVEACKGQSVAAIGKKAKKDGKFKLKEATTCQQFCDSFRLLQHLHNFLNGLPPFMSSASVDEIPETGQNGLRLLKLLYQNTDISKKDIFEVLTSWRDEIVTKMKDIKFTNLQEVESIVGNWQLETRLQGRKISPLLGVNDDHSKLCSLMSEIGGPVNTMEPEQIILIARAGSHMYGLSTPESDVDYVVIYTEKTETILSSCKCIKDNYESRGPTKSFEYGAYEVKLFCEMLLKGSVVIVELVFTDNHEYSSIYWKNLCKEKMRFLTEKTIQQYLGLIRNNFNMLDSEKHKGSLKDRKLFYQIFHKINSVEHIMNGEIPPVKVEGDVKDFIMKIRREPLEGSLSRENLYQHAKQKFDKLLDDLAYREKRLKENMDYIYVSEWLLSVRGVPEDHV